MRKCLLAVWIFVCSVHMVAAQGRPTLYYFTTAEQHVGVKDAAGKMIIPAEYVTFGEQNGDTVIGDVIYLLTRPKDSAGLGYASPFKAFNRKGQFLFTPFQYDNGPDYLSEGLFRIVQQDKIGFANRSGEVVIQPQFNFALPFLYGLSFFCNDCHFYKDTAQGDSEHNLRLSDAHWGLLAKDGSILIEDLAPEKEIVEDLDLAQFVSPGITNSRLEVTDSLLATIPAPFNYTPFEAQLLQKMKTYPQLGTAIAANLPKDAHSSVVYEIVERPGSNFDFYWVEGYAIINGVYNEGEEHFLISSDGKRLYRYTPRMDTKERILGWQEKMRLRRQ